MNTVNYEILKKNLLYVLKESQIKIGYTKNAVVLNYPLDSLNRLLETECSFDEMEEVLQGFCGYAQTELGDMKIGTYEGKYSITIPAEGVEYVHENIKDSGFLTDLVALMKSHGNISVDDVLKVFYKYSDNVRCVEAENDEFNYIIYFEDGIPDEFIYCLDIDLGHASYHRLTHGDFKAFGFDSYLH